MAKGAYWNKTRTGQWHGMQPSDENHRAKIEPCVLLYRERREQERLSVLTASASSTFTVLFKNTFYISIFHYSIEPFKIRREISLNLRMKLRVKYRYGTNDACVHDEGKNLYLSSNLDEHFLWYLSRNDGGAHWRVYNHSDGSGLMALKSHYSHRPFDFLLLLRFEWTRSRNNFARRKFSQKFCLEETGKIEIRWKRQPLNEAAEPLHSCSAQLRFYGHQRWH